METFGNNSNSKSNTTDLLAPSTRPTAGSEIAVYGDDALGMAGSAHAVTGASLMSSLVRRKWLMLIVTLVVAGAAIPCIWLFFAPYYRATASIRIQPVIDRIVFKDEKSGSLPMYQSFVNTEVSVIRSPTALGRVLDRPELQETEWYKETFKMAQAGSIELLERLQLSLEVAPRRGTELIDVSFNAPKAHDSKVIADLVVDEYRKLRDEIEKANKIQLFETLTTELTSRQMEIDGLIRTRFGISKMLGTDAPEGLRSQLSQSHSALESEYRKAQRDLEMMQWELKLMVSTETQPAGSIAPDYRYVGDSEWRQLHFNVEEARHAAEVAKQTLGPLNPRMKQVAANLEHAERLMKEREGQIDDISKTTPVADPSTLSLQQGRDVLEHQSRKKEHEISLLQVELDHQRTKLGEAGDIALEITKFDERIRQKRELYEAVRSRHEQLEMEEKAPARIRVAAQAVEPFKPYNDRRILLTAAAIILALGSGVGAGYVRASMDKRIYDSKEIQHICPVPFLGLLPKLPSAHVPRELGGVPSAMRAVPETVIDPRIVLMENMRMIRTTFLERVSKSNKSVVLITSCLPHTGKTSVAVLLAQSLALVGKKVLLVEADLRRPVLGERLGVDAKLGLGALISGQAGDREVIHRAEFARFDLLPAGELPDDFNPELMANGVFSACIARWRKAYDFVLLDSPPLLRVADAQILAGSADGTIMVLRSSHDRRTEALQALSQLNAVGGSLLGTVLIGDQLGQGHYSNYGYGYGYDYNYSSNDRFIENQKKTPENAANSTVTG